jgi:hypothetical protein
MIPSPEDRNRSASLTCVSVNKSSSLATSIVNFPWLALCWFSWLEVGFFEGHVSALLSPIP